VKDNDQAVSYFRQSLATFVNLNDKRLIALAQLNLGAMYVQLNDAVAANQLLSQSRSALHELGDVASEAKAFESLGRAANVSSEYREALAHYRESMRLL